MRKKITFLFLLFAITFSVSAQIKNTFDVRYQGIIKGDLTMISNNVVNRSPSPNTAYNTVGSSSIVNDETNMQYIDIDGDASTFCSSSANLNLANPNCSNIVHAGLYWSGTYRYNLGNDPSSGRAADWNQVKFKMPNGTYIDVTATEVLYEGFSDTDQTNVAHGPYACFADVTSLITNSSNINGTYTVGNIRVSQNGSNTSTFPITGGVSGGWSLVIVYEDNLLTGKKITTFDGYAVLTTSVGNVDIPINGLSTLPNPLPINAKIGVIALEGDNKITGDQLQIKANSTSTGFTQLSNTPLPTSPITTNYFNSSITLNGSDYLDRNPNSLNTLGWDNHLEAIPNPSNSIIPNNETGVTLRATTVGDKYDMFFASFDVEIIEPDILITLEVEDISGNPISNQSVVLNQEIIYTVNVQNVGNDNATNLIITDYLPSNVVFPPNGISVQPGDIILPTGSTYSYNPTSGLVTFSLPDNLLTVGSASNIIQFKVKITNDCSILTDACSNVIQNQASYSYQGFYNTNVVSNNLTFSTLDQCNEPVSQVSNFIIDLSPCNFDETISVCEDDNEISAFDGYDSYIWTNSSGTQVGNAQTIAITNSGQYTVAMTKASPCASISKTFDVVVVTLPCNLSNEVFHSNQISFYPNPVKDIFEIKSINNINSIEVYTVLGQLVNSISINQKETNLDLSNLKKATYIIKIISDNKTETIRIIKE